MSEGPIPAPGWTDMQYTSYVQSTHTGTMEEQTYPKSPKPLFKAPITHTQHTHIVVASFVVLVFCLYVDGELGQERALWIKKEKDVKPLVKNVFIKSNLCAEQKPCVSALSLLFYCLLNHLKSKYRSGEQPILQS